MQTKIEFIQLHKNFGVLQLHLIYINQKGFIPWSQLIDEFNIN